MTESFPRGHGASVFSLKAQLDMLDAANDLRILGALPGNRLERLRGDREARYSIRINDQWRICFAWQEGDAYDVEITDYH